MVRHRLLLGEQPCGDERSRDYGQKNADGPIGPAPVGLVEALGEKRARKRSDNEGGRSEGEREAPVLQHRGVGS